GGKDKQLMTLRGIPVFIHSLRVLQDSPRVDHICVVFADHNIEAGRQAIRDDSDRKIASITTGGARRQDSVRIGIEALDASGIEFDWLLIHDGARPFIDEEMITRGLAAAQVTGATVASVPLKDTVKQVSGERVVATPDRSALRAVQTPQVFRASVLKSAHTAIAADVTDDASMVEKNGGMVTVFEGDYDNIKITTPGDVTLAEAIFDRRQGQPATGERRRWGVGFDGHALSDGGPLRLGGVEIPFEFGLAGHSDGDVLLHAITSALLGAAGLGDMGSNFPSSDEFLEGIDSAELLRRSLEKMKQSGWEAEHVDATIIAQRPRLSGHVAAIRDRIASVIGLDPASVNIKVTSTDHVGAIGEGKGIAAQAIATLVSTRP
ncbi:MAG: 2-C-methyl-D-erythritol 4-phosphate cytidylyltransferase, partial [Chloroflexi bacterium]|nr:2-C-methyl-D-erythritol 4-phosphate cytidylyltransferase [Chloroflexota bacterium]